MNDQQQRALRTNLPDLVKQLDPREVVPYIRCLSQQSLEEIEARQTTIGKSAAVNALHNHLIRKPQGFDELIDALREPSVNSIQLADQLIKDLAEISANTRGRYGFGIQLSPGNSTPSNSRGPGVHVWLPSSAGRQEVFPGPKSDSGSSFANGATGCVSPKAQLTLKSLWGQLPPGVQRILRRFDSDCTLVKPEDLADLFGFVNDEIEKIKREVLPGESFTVAIIKCATQSRSVTLGDIYNAFHKLERKDILHELQEKTGVRFETPEAEEPTLTQNTGMSSGESQPSQLVNMRNAHDPNINHPCDKSSVGYTKSVLKKEDWAVNLPGSVHSNGDNSNCDNNDTNIQGENAEPNVNDKKGRFLGYKPEEILAKREDESAADAYPDSNIRSEKNTRYQEFGKDKGAREFPEDFVLAETSGSGGFRVAGTTDGIDKNNLDRSYRTLSSNTENSTYNNLVSNGHLNDLIPSPGDKVNSDDDDNNITIAVNEKETGRNLKTPDKLIPEVWAKEEISFDKVNHSESKRNSRCKPDIMSEGLVEIKTNERKHLHENERLFQTEEAQFDGTAMRDEVENMLPDISNTWSQTSKEGLLSLTAELVGEKIENNMPKNTFQSIENYIDYSLEDSKIDYPKSIEQSINSIERKGGKKLPGYDNHVKGLETELSDDFNFKFSLDSSEEDVSVDGEAGDGQMNETRSLEVAREPYEFESNQETSIKQLVYKAEDEEFMRRDCNNDALVFPKCIENERNKAIIEEPPTKSEETPEKGEETLMKSVVKKEEMSDDTPVNGLNMSSIEVFSNGRNVFGGRGSRQEGQEEIISHENGFQIDNNSSDKEMGVDLSRHGNELMLVDRKENADCDESNLIDNEATDHCTNTLETDTREGHLSLAETVLKVLKVVYDNYM